MKCLATFEKVTSDPIRMLNIKQRLLNVKSVQKGSVQMDYCCIIFVMIVKQKSNSNVQNVILSMIEGMAEPLVEFSTGAHKIR